MGDMTREPSMEEILSSIRRVIARDEELREEITTVAETEEEDVLDLTNPSEEPTMARTATATKEINLSEDAIVSRNSVQASRLSLEALAAAIAEQEDAAIAPVQGDVSVNNLVQAMVRPMLKDWLDANLPAIVERMVAKEIARISGPRG